MLSYQLEGFMNAEGTVGSLSPSKRYFQNPQKLTEPAKFQYLTLLNAISYETHWMA
jgi:hypothetical protein